MPSSRSGALGPAVARKSAFARLLDHFQNHPRGRLHEFLFWAGLGVGLGVTTFLLWRTDFLSDPIAWILLIVSVCFVGWSLLPRGRGPPKPRLPPGKRGAIAQQVRASKAERKRKGPPPPHPPIRRG